MRFAKNTQHDTSKVLRLPRKMTMDTSKVLRLPRKLQHIFWKRRKSIAPATQNDFRHVAEHVCMSRSATPATRNEATRRLKPPKRTTSAKLPIGTAIRSSHERLRPQTQRRANTPSTPRPPEWNGNPCYAFGNHGINTTTGVFDCATIHRKGPKSCYIDGWNLGILMGLSLSLIDGYVNDNWVAINWVVLIDGSRDTAGDPKTYLAARSHESFSQLTGNLLDFWSRYNVFLLDKCFQVALIIHWKTHLNLLLGFATWLTHQHPFKHQTSLQAPKQVCCGLNEHQHGA